MALASHGTDITYAKLAESLKFDTVRQLEDFVIDAIYRDVIKGRLNPKKQLVEIADWRSPQPGKAELENAAQVLGRWVENSAAFIESLGKEVERSNQLMKSEAEREKLIEAESEKLKKEFLVSSGRLNTFTPEKAWSKNSDAKRHKKETNLRSKRGGN